MMDPDGTLGFLKDLDGSMWISMHSCDFQWIKMDQDGTRVIQIELNDFKGFQLNQNGDLIESE